MSEHDDKWYLKGQAAPSLYGWIFQNMALGATYGAIVFFGAIAFILIIKAISALLPEDPFAALETFGALAALA